MFTILRHAIHQQCCGFFFFFFSFHFVLGSFCITLKYFFKLWIRKTFHNRSAISNGSQMGESPAWIIEPIRPLYRKKKRDPIILYLRIFSKQSLSIIQWAALFFPICYHKVILQDATAISLSRTHFTGLMKTITLYNILETFTTHSKLHENPASLQVIFQYCLNGSDAGRESKWLLAGSQTQTFWRWVMTKELLLSLFSSFWIVLCNFPSFLPTGDPERTGHSFAVCLQQLLFP